MEQPTDAAGWKAKGNAALSGGNAEEAVACYTKAIELDATGHVYFSNRSNAYTKLGKFQEALEDANKTIELKPEWPRGYSRKGVALFFLRQYTEAADTYKEGLKVDPENASFKEEVSRCEAFKVAEPFLKDDYFAILSTTPSTAPMMQDKEFVDKIEQIRANPTLLPQLLSSDQKIGHAFIVLSGMEQQMREQQMREAKARDEARRQQREAEKKRKAEEEENKKREAFEALSPEEQDSIREKEQGNAAYKAKKFEEALGHYAKAYELNPNNVLLLTNQAAVYMAQKDFESAVKVCTQAVDRAKEIMAPYAVLGKALERKAKALGRLGQWEECVKVYEEAILNARTPELVRAKNAAVSKLKAKQAQEYLDPDKAKEAKAMGNEFFKKQQWGDAIKYYTEAIKRDPTDKVFFSNRAVTYMKVREYNLSMEDADKCVELDPTFIKGWVRKAMSHFYRKEYHKALDALDKASAIDPNYPEIPEWTGKVMRGLNQMRQAEEGNKDAEEARKRAMADPAIQRVLADPEVQNLNAALRAGDQQRAQNMIMKSASLRTKFETLRKAGLM